MLVKWLWLHPCESLRWTWSFYGSSTDPLPRITWSDGLPGSGSQDLHAKSQLGLSRWRKWFHLQASFAKEEKVVQRKSSLESTSCSRGQMLQLSRQQKETLLLPRPHHSPCPYRHASGKVSRCHGQAVRSRNLHGNGSNSLFAFKVTHFL